MGTIKKLPLNSINATAGTQSRVALNQDTVAEYAEALAQGAEFPPVVVFSDGSVDGNILADGFHRFHAHRAANLAEIVCDVRVGTLRDAKLFSAGANGTHGLRRTNADKRHAVTMLIEDLEWRQWSDREISRQCGVGAPLVADVRKTICNPITDAPDVRTVERNGKTYEMNTAKIGKVESDSTPAPANIEPAAKPELEAVEAEDHAAPDLVAELETADKEIRRMSSLIEQLTNDSDHAKIAAEWSVKFDQLSGRNAQLIRTLNEAQKQARYANDMLAKIRKALGVLSNTDIIPALMARRMA